MENTAPERTTDCSVRGFEIGTGYGPATRQVQLDGECPTGNPEFSETYTALAPGDHTFKVRAQTSAGWGPNEFRTITVSGDAPLTAEWVNAPSSHRYPNAFNVTLRFSKPVDITREKLLNHVIGYMGGIVTDVQPTTRGDTTGWTVTMTPDSPSEDAMMGIWGGEHCWQPYAVCAGTQRLSNSPEIAIPAP